MSRCHSVTPLAFPVLVANAGNGVETRLLAYVLTYAVAIGTTPCCAWITHKAAKHLRLI